MVEIISGGRNAKRIFFLCSSLTNSGEVLLNKECVLSVEVWKSSPKILVVFVSLLCLSNAVFWIHSYEGAQCQPV